MNEQTYAQIVIGQQRGGATHHQVKLIAKIPGGGVILSYTSSYKGLDGSSRTEFRILNAERDGNVLWDMIAR